METCGAKSLSSRTSERTYPNPEVRKARTERGVRGKRKASAEDAIRTKEAKLLDLASAKPKPAQYIIGHVGGMAELRKGDGCFVGCWKGVFQEQHSILARLMEEVEWLDKEVVVRGKTYIQPRKIAYMADSPDMNYSYSGLVMVPQSYSPTVQMIKQRLEHEGFGGPLKFNCVLLNLYRDGLDHVNWHSDNEPLFGEAPVIGSVSFGVERDFVLKDNVDSTRKYLFTLGNGDVLVMAGDTQSKYKHCIPKRKSLKGSRVNLTFRTIVDRGLDSTQMPEKKLKIGTGTCVELS